MTSDYNIIHGNALDVLKTLEANSVDAVVTDPPYELGFMGKAWDRSGIAYNVELWQAVLRVLKPGGQMLAFGGSRTYHRMVVAIEDAGFEIRDQLQWIYGSGFPKSLDVSKAIDKMQGVEGEKVWSDRYHDGRSRKVTGENNNNWGGTFAINGNMKTLPATDAAKQWQGFGTALKPANEPICLARKPLEKGLTVAQNVLKWGTGALNIDGCRLEEQGRKTGTINAQASSGSGNVYTGSNGQKQILYDSRNQGRFPANVIHDGSDEVEAEFAKVPHVQPCGGPKTTIHDSGMFGIGTPGTIYSDFGSPSRFFYCAKTSQSERNKNNAVNGHPTVKPVALMAYLCRLISPPSGLILDPFNGSGSTGIGALQERFRYIGIELDAEYVEISRRRLSELQVNLF